MELRRADQSRVKENRVEPQTGGQSRVQGNHRQEGRVEYRGTTDRRAEYKVWDWPAEGHKCPLSDVTGNHFHLQFCTLFH